MRVVTHGEAETEALAARLAARLGRGDVVLLYGGLGAGKTAFVRGLARGLGCGDGVSSPTFALMHRYDGAMPLNHFDLYRLGDALEVEEIGFLEALDEGVTAVEWPQVAEPLLRRPCVRVTLEMGEAEDERLITIEGEGAERFVVPGG
jgi:tRNA threonylcarbamoyladenosine biosynthesis protein TsaE